MDIESKGCAFTWSNNRDKENPVQKRSNGVLGNLEWRVSFPKAKPFSLLAIGSNYSPLVLSLCPKSHQRKNEFQVEAYWLDDEEFGGVVSVAWLSEDKNRGDLSRQLQSY